MRTGYTKELENIAHDIDSSIYKYFMEIINIKEHLPNNQDRIIQQFFLPISKGGLGFTSSQQNLHIASIGGFALNISKIIKIIQHENDNYWKDEYLECFIDAEIPNKEDLNGIDLDFICKKKFSFHEAFDFDKLAEESSTQVTTILHLVVSMVIFYKSGIPNQN
jgi:hypothetical protein